jgi:uncharacterized membrane protein
MQTMRNVLKWTVVVGGTSGLMLLSGIFAAWLMIEALVVLVNFTA